MKVLIIVAHPRNDSLTMSITKRLIEGIEASGNNYELLELYEEKFNPVLMNPDEPDWNNPNKIYSDEVIREMERIKSSDSLVFVFPVWWYSVPAIMKGYLDRVWNFGFAYGNSNKLPIKKIRWMALTGFTQEKLEKRKYDQMMEHYFNIGLAGFVGVKDSKVHFITNTLEESEQEKAILFNKYLDEAYEIGYQL